MPQKTLTVPDFQLTSTWVVSQRPPGHPDEYARYISSAPTIVDTTTAFDFSSIPTGADITYVHIYTTLGNPLSGRKILKIGMDGDPDWWDFTGNTSYTGAVKRRFAAGYTSIKAWWRFQANGDADYVGNRSSTQWFYNVHMEVTYTDPYGPCSPPTTVTIPANVAPNSNQTLSWSGASGGTNNAITGYWIYRASSDNSTYEWIGDKVVTSNTYGSTTVRSHATSGKSYYYKVMTAGSVDGKHSGQSSAVGSMKSHTTSPTAPSNLSLSENNVPPGKSVKLSWSASSNGDNNNVTGYQIQRAKPGGSWETIVSSQVATSVNVSARSDNGDYQYRVIALAPYSNSSVSAVISLTTEFSAPSTPGSVSISPASVGASGSSLLSWTASTDGTNNAVTGYKIERATSSSGPWSTVVSSQTQTEKNVIGHSENNAIYHYRITALAPYGNSSASSAVTQTTEWTAPTQPSNLTLTANDVAPSETVVLSWDASDDGTNNAITGYRIERSTYQTYGYETLVVSQADTEIGVVARNVTGQSYYYRVIALAPNQNSLVSDYIELRTLVGVLSPPTDVLLNGSVNSTVSPVSTVPLTWTLADGKINNAVTGYKIYESVSAMGDYVEIGSVAADVSSFNITTQPDVGTRYFKVATIGTHSNSTQSGFVSITVSLTTADASTFSTSPSSIPAGTQTTVTITSPSESYSHKVWIKFGAKSSDVVSLNPGTLTWAYTIPMEWLTEIPNALTGSAVVTVETYLGLTLKGRRTSNVIITVPSSVVPTLASFVGTRVNNSVPVEWGLYVVSKSQVDLVMGQGQGAYGSTIVSYRLQGGGMNIGGISPISQRSPIISSVSTTYTATVVDSRGRSNSYPITVSAEPYSPPSLSVDTYRSNNLGEETDDGEYGVAKATVAYSSVSGKNSVVIKSMYREKNSTAPHTSISDNMISGNGVIFGDGNIDQGKYYEVLYVVTDGVGTVISFTDEISAADYLLYFRNNGRGFGVGGPASSDDTVELHWKLKLHQDMQVSTTTLVENLNADTIDGKHYSDIEQAIVDATPDWESIGGKPETFPPAEHNQPWSSITNPPATYTPSQHNHPVSQITDFPSSMPASDVHAWAKAETKPAYSASEVGALPTTGGTITGDVTMQNGTILDPGAFARLTSWANQIDGKPFVWNIHITSNGTPVLGWTDSDGVSSTLTLSGYNPLAPYPVGAIYMSLDATNPASLFGGTWTAIQNRFLIGAGSSYGAGGTGGDTTHAHGLGAGFGMFEETTAYTVYRYKNVSTWTSTYGVSSYNAQAIGGNRSTGMVLGGTTDSAGHMPPYYAVYMWRRTA